MILAIDTSSALTSVAVIDGDTLVIERSHLDARHHAEVLGPLLEQVCAAIDVQRVTTVACGVGPGPYTGLRIGIASAIALGLAWNRPVVGVCSLDALALAVLKDAPGVPVTVASDARRSELYWARYDGDGRRVEGPRVSPAADVMAQVGQPEARWAARRVSALLAAGEQVATRVPDLDAHGADTGATAEALAGATLLPPRALYLRRPDAVATGDRP